MDLRKIEYWYELENLQGNTDLTEIRNNIKKSWSGDLQKQFLGGAWRTMNGAKVFINGGKVVAGLNGFNREIDEFFDKKDKQSKQAKETKEVNKDGEKKNNIEYDHSIPHIAHKKLTEKYGENNFTAKMFEKEMNKVENSKKETKETTKKESEPSKKESTEEIKGDPEKVKSLVEGSRGGMLYSYRKKYKDFTSYLLDGNEIRYEKQANELANLTDEQVKDEKFKGEGVEKREAAKILLKEISDAKENVKNIKEKNQNTAKDSKSKIGDLVTFDGEGIDDIDYNKVMTQGNPIENIKNIKDYINSTNIPVNKRLLSKGKLQMDYKGEVNLPQPEPVKVKETSTEDALKSLVDPSGIRPIITGIHYDPDGYVVATDANKIVAIKTDVGDKSGKTIDPKTGKEIEGKYPNWKGVIPSYSDSVKVKLSDLHAHSKQVVDFHKLIDSPIITTPIHKDLPHSFNSKYLNETVEAMRKLGVEDAEINYSNNPSRGVTLVGKNKKGEEVTGLLMPVTIDKEDLGSPHININEKGINKSINIDDNSLTKEEYLQELNNLL